MEGRQLHAPAADVHRGAVYDRKVVHSAEEAEPGLEVAVDHLQRNPQRPSLLDEPLAVTRLSDRCGRNRVMRSAPAPSAIALKSQGIDRSVDRVRPEVVVVEFPTEAERRARVFEHIEVLPGRSRKTIIRAEFEPTSTTANG